MSETLDPKQFLAGCHVTVWPEIYAVCKVKEVPAEYVAVIKDHQETTVIAKAGEISSEYILEEERGWKIITFDAVLPFELVGFLAVVSKVLAEAGVSIFALSAFSTDHVLVKEAKLDLALSKLQTLGCIVN